MIKNSGKLSLYFFSFSSFSYNTFLAGYTKRVLKIRNKLSASSIQFLEYITQSKDDLMIRNNGNLWRYFFYEASLRQSRRVQKNKCIYEDDFLKETVAILHVVLTFYIVHTENWMMGCVQQLPYLWKKTPVPLFFFPLLVGIH